ncbi:MAG: hypothetical protein KH025_10865, partial [Megasphaera sp.]|uniref:hypothetical protein n=1 Tax=Megasphaera sp. TaxID=2023260 RepID=UPI0025BE2DCF
SCLTRSQKAGYQINIRHMPSILAGPAAFPPADWRRPAPGNLFTINYALMYLSPFISFQKYP